MNIKKILVSTAAGAIMLGVLVVPAFADSVSVNFEPSTYTVGNINGQDGWTKTGSYDVAVVSNTFRFASFGAQSLRTSDAITSGSFGDQTFAKPLVNAVGEADSTNGTFSAGTLQRHFEMQFDIASTQAIEQSGMHVSVSPDRGDGSRMSYLRFDDAASGINVFFDDVQGITNPANFVETQIGTGLDRTVPHTIKLTLDTLDGPSNDVVKVWIDGVLKITGTSWENYYRYDPEASAEQSPRIVKTVIFRESGAANAADSEKGFLIDNLSMSSSTPTPKRDTDICKKGSWNLFESPAFRNQGACVSYIETYPVTWTDGDIWMGGDGEHQQMKFTALDYGDSLPTLDTGTVEYWNNDYPGGLHYTASVLCANVDKASNTAYFAFQIPGSLPGLSGLGIAVRVVDEGTPGINGDLFGFSVASNGSGAVALCKTGFSPDHNYDITAGNLVVH